ncbi:MAG TPA: family 1 glycosylhydrolase [Caulobacteraceae bacterium]|jgi:beta-glucosidase
MTSRVDRRALLLGSAAAAGAGGARSRSKRPGPGPGGHFLWGSAGAAYQIEGGNYASDVWLLEHLQPKLFQEPSGDADDTYHRYREDIALAASFGFNAHRLSIEWSRIEPEPGQISTASLAYYQRVLETIRAHGMTPVVTFNHFTTPRWFAAAGGFSTPAGVEPFVRYCRLLSERLGHLIGLAATFNEPNLGAQLSWSPTGARTRPAFDAVLRSARAASGSPNWSAPVLGDWRVQQPIMIEAHNRAYDAIKSASSSRFPVGVTLALAEERDPAEGPSGVANKQSQVMTPWLAGHGDFVGVQNYTYAVVSPEGDLPPPRGVELTQMGYPFAPEALEGVIRVVAARTKRPIYVTENGVATLDDARRVAFIDRATQGLFRCLADGIDVRGYIHWSLLDNWEWFAGYRPKFGLVAVDRQSFQRTPKPSAHHLGRIARAGLPAGLRA